MSVHSWKRQRELARTDIIPSQSELFRVASSIEIAHERCLFVLTYLTAGRISEILGIRRDGIETVRRGERDVLLIRMPNKKHRKRRFKTIPIPLDKEKSFVDLIYGYISHRDGPLFDFGSERRAEQILAKYGYNPHWLRHLRLTHLVTIYDMNEELIKKFAGWTDTRPARHYMELRWTDILQKM
jgi:integrase